MDVYIDILFVIDMIINFRTTYVNDQYLEITDRNQIAMNYIKGRFIVDFLSTIPFDTVFTIFTGDSESKQFQILRSLKWARVLRLNKIILYLNVK